MRHIAAMFAAAIAIGGCSSSGGTALSTPTAASPTPIIPSPTSSPTPGPVLATPTGPSPNKSSFKLTRIAAGLNNPVYVTGAGDASGRVFIVEQVGRIRVVKAGVLLPAPFLDIRPLVASGGERGLLSVAFHPQFKSNGAFVVDYTRSSTNPSAVG